LKKVKRLNNLIEDFII